MSQIIFIRYLNNTAEISEKCYSTGELLFVTKNGCGDSDNYSTSFEEQSDEEAFGLL